MFRRRSQDEQASGTTVLDDRPRDPQAPKGRPTPKRSQAQSARRKAATAPTDRKAAARSARETRRVELAKQREALAGGDERYLPHRDRGPVRKFVRDYVDSRFRVAEFFLPIAVLIMIMSLVQIGSLRDISLLLWLVVIVLIVTDSLVTGLRLRSLLRRKFAGENIRGAVAYGLMRSIQMRRLRLPKPRTGRGVKG